MIKGATYVVAGSRKWNQRDFDFLAKTCAGRWLYVVNEAELEKVCGQESPRYIFFLHWNWRVPASIWESFECVCFHMTDVPYGRGGSPLQNLIIAGHEHTFVSALQMVGDIDAGPVYAKRPLDLAGRAEEVYERAGAICVEIIRWMIRAKPEPLPQHGEPVIFKRRNPAQSELPADCSIPKVYDHIRMLDAPGYPYAFIQYGVFRIEFSNAEIFDDEVVARVVIRARQEKE